MAAFGLWHVFILIVLFTLVLVPISTILRRAGWSGWLCLLWAVPVLNILAIWLFALSPWPNLPDHS